MNINPPHRRAVMAGPLSLNPPRVRKKEEDIIYIYIHLARIRLELGTSLPTRLRLGRNDAPESGRIHLPESGLWLWSGLWFSIIKIRQTKKHNAKRVDSAIPPWFLPLMEMVAKKKNIFTRFWGSTLLWNRARWAEHTPIMKPNPLLGWLSPDLFQRFKL